MSKNNENEEASEVLKKAFDELNDEDWVRVERLVLKLAEQTQRRTVPEKVAKQIKRASRKRVLDGDESAPTIKQGARGKRRRPEGPAVKRRGQDKPQRKKFASREAIDTSSPRKNKFEDMAAFHQDKEKNSKYLEYAPTPRMGRQALVEAECKVCGYIFDIDQSLVYMDPDEGAVFTCNDCASSRRHG